MTSILPNSLNSNLEVPLANPLEVHSVAPFRQKEKRTCGAWNFGVLDAKWAHDYQTTLNFKGIFATGFHNNRSGGNQGPTRAVCAEGHVFRPGSQFDYKHMKRLIPSYISFINKAKNESSQDDVDNICQKSFAVAHECLTIAMDENLNIRTRRLYYRLVPSLINSLKQNWNKKSSICTLDERIEQCRDRFDSVHVRRKILDTVCTKDQNCKSVNPSVTKTPLCPLSDPLSDSERTETDDEGASFRAKRQKVSICSSPTMAVEKNPLDVLAQAALSLPATPQSMPSQPMPTQQSLGASLTASIPHQDHKYIAMWAVWIACNQSFESPIIAYEKFLELRKISELS